NQETIPTPQSSRPELAASPKSDAVDLEMLAKNGYAFSPQLNTGQPIRPAGYEEKRSAAPTDNKSSKAQGKRGSEQTNDQSEPVPLGLRYSEVPQYR
ncbi:MAG: hypothetical protein Q4G59_11915, partial [Planctomycetia bacterium]|nr:hypothetical protein [Planctomycetia bacterium]